MQKLYAFSQKFLGLSETSTQGKNYREALKTIKKDKKIYIETEKSRFNCPNIDTDDVIEARKALHWLELGNEILDCNLRFFLWKDKICSPNI